MCIVSFAWKAHPDWPLIVIGNRDELHARAAEPLRRWKGHDHLLAGRDTSTGGTWLGVSEQGRFVVVTNRYGYGGPDPDRVSRGEILKDFLSGDGEYAEPDAAQYGDFNPFNLITVDGNEAFVHTNRPDNMVRPLDPGIHGLSNGPIDDPWPKSPHLNSALEDWIAAGADDPARLFDALTDRTSFHVGHGDWQPSPTQPEPEASPVFICSPTYGTRCSTVVAIDRRGQGIIIERRFAPSGETTGETCLEFAWPVPE